MARGWSAHFSSRKGKTGGGVIVALIAMTYPVEVHAQAPPLIGPHWALGQPAAFSDTRLRFETVHGGGRGDASAMTLRLRSGVEVALNDRTAALFELESVTDISSDESRSKVGRRLIPDRPVLELNRAQISYALPSVRFVGGRQRLELADERFVGSSAFRQNEQTYDAVRVIAATPLGLTAEATYIWQVNRFNSSTASRSRWTGDTTLLQLGAPTPLGRVKAFHYVMDLTDERSGIRDARASNETSGVGITGSWRNNGIDWEWRADYAWQRDHGANPFDYRADYSRFQVKLDAERVAFVLNRERLGSEGVRGFQTPLGSNHAFQGSADLFVVTPATGVRDLSLEAVLRFPALGPVRNVTVLARRHEFDSDLDGAGLGSEWDATVSGTVRGYRLSVDHARYSAESFGDDTTRTWLTIARIF